MTQGSYPHLWRWIPATWPSRMGAPVFDVCPRCSEYAADKEVVADTPNERAAWAICPHCGHRTPFLRLPLFTITGASGSGKTTVCLHMSRRTSQVIFLESDILWRSEFNQPDDDAP